MTPWSGYYEAGQLGDGMGGSQNGAAIWTNAHVCQFVEVPVATAVVPMCPPPFHFASLQVLDTWTHACILVPSGVEAANPWRFLTVLFADIWVNA